MPGPTIANPVPLVSEMSATSAEKVLGQNIKALVQRKTRGVNMKPDITEYNLEKAKGLGIDI